MRWGKRVLEVVLFFFIIFLGVSKAATAQTVVKGFVKDANTMEPIPFVSVYFKGANGVMTGADGSYTILSRNPKEKSLIFSYVGYKNVTKNIEPGKTQEVNVVLAPDETMAEIVVKVKRRPKYRNKNNPAVALIEKVIEHKKQNEITAYDYVQYQQYEKMSLSIVNNPQKLKNNIFLKKYKFLLENVDTTSIEGKSILPMYVQEKLSDVYLRKDPKEDKTVVLGEKQVNYGSLLDMGGINSYLKRLYSDINIYENNITILNIQFLSPIADGGPTFYRYYIRDTVELDGVKLVQLFFTPRNPADMIFRGTMYITLDGNYGVQKVDMTVSSNANLNLTRELQISQQFEKAPDGHFHVVKSTMSNEFALTKKATGGLYGERTVTFRDFVINQPAPDSIYKRPDVVVLNKSENRPDSFWTDQRPPDALTAQEAKTYYNIDSLKGMRSFQRLSNVLTFVFAGWIHTKGGYAEIGNTNTFYSFNPVEGFRVKFGARTTPKLSDKLYFQSNVAYGFKDEKFKYLFSGTYSFNHKSIYSYPLNYLQVSYQHETSIPGQELLFVQEDNLFLSFKRGNNNQWLYNKYFKTQYVREFGHNLSYHFTFRNWNQTPAGDIFFEKSSGNEFIHDITTTDLTGELRWAPNEQFYQTKNFRIPIINRYPVLSLSVTQAMKGILDGQYNYQIFHLRGDKRFYMSQLGFLDGTLEGGYLLGKVPFPLLLIQRANQTYAFQDNSYNMMNFLEFVSDKYASARLDFYFNGFFLNKIPVLKKLKLREVGTFKILYGGLRDENNPEKNAELFKFPVDKDGGAITYPLENTPYMEASVGLANIFKFFRVDLVRRLNYLDHPNTIKWGIRTLVQFQF